jgi:hypothetical protein
MSIKGNAVIGQSGGPTNVINQSLVGVIETVRSYGHIDKLLGARRLRRSVRHATNRMKPIARRSSRASKSRT